MSDRVSKMFDGIKLIRRKYISISEVISLSYSRYAECCHGECLGASDSKLLSNCDH